MVVLPVGVVAAVAAGLTLTGNEWTIGRRLGLNGLNLDILVSCL